jgi:hypothetical protein
MQRISPPGMAFKFTSMAGGSSHDQLAFEMGKEESLIAVYDWQAEFVSMWSLWFKI